MHSCWRRLVADLDLILQSTSLVRGNRPAFRGFTKLAAQVPHTLYPHTAHNTLSVLWGVSVVVVPLGRTRVLRELIGWSGIPRTRPVGGRPPPPPDDPRCPNPARRRRRCWAFGIRRKLQLLGRLLEKLGHRIGCGNELARGIAHAAQAEPRGHPARSVGVVRQPRSHRP